MRSLKIIRPLNCMMIALGSFCGMLLVKNILEFGNLLVPIIPALICSFLIGAGGNVLNDYYDRAVDSIIKPSRPLPRGELTAEQARALAILLLSTGAFAGILTFNCLAIIIALLAILLLASYEKIFKRRGFSGNLIISALVAFVFLFGGASVNVNLELNALKPLIIMAILAFLSTLGREIVKDIEDMKGDRIERHTLPLKIGITKASVVGACALITAIALSTLPYILKIFDWIYLVIILPADVIFIYSISLFLKYPAKASTMIKLGMAIALFGFIINSIL
ncbi:MAG: UbiA family prenyltransferase [Candidatus Thermoplasmatota archaeon]